MNHELVRKIQRSNDSVWVLPERASMTLRVGPGARVMHALAGRLWLTSSGSAREASLDVWLEAGESLELPNGLEVVLEAWPRARFQLLVPPSVCRRSSGRMPATTARVAAWARRLAQAFGGPLPQFARR